MKVEIYLRPVERPYNVVDSGRVRIYYNNQWVDFRDGEIVITKDYAAGSCEDCGKLPEFKGGVYTCDCP